MFIDRVRIFVRGGRGGDGCVSFRREKHVPRGGPDGGDGGKGGDVIARVDSSMRTLLDFRYRQHYRAQAGKPGQGKRMTGRNGEDTIIKVPAGTVIEDADTHEIIADLTEEAEEIVVARGGRGGKGNYAFRSAVNQAPRKATRGQPGEERNLWLTLKLIADVGLVGLPNAGKSTMLRSLSDAHPVVADYPFLTIDPVLGMVKVGKGESFCMVDIPGLIEGAHEGRGLGIKFLRHIERCRVLIFVIDLAAEASPDEAYRQLIEEMRQYNVELVKKPKLIALNKADMIDSESLRKVNDMISGGVFDTDVFVVSALSKNGLDKLVFKAYSELKKLDAMVGKGTSKSNDTISE
ncbi:GTPase ObgE [bacterium]|nr:MAG: GTPase ObgE [bacterium]